MMNKHPKKVKHAVAATLALSLAVPTASALAAEQSSAALEPVRETATKLGAEVSWEQSTRTITVTKGSHVLKLEAGSDRAVLDGETVALNQPVRLSGGRTLADAGLIAKALTGDNGQTEDAADLFLEALQAGDGAKAAEYVSEASAYALPAALLDRLWSNYEAMFGKTAGEPAKSESLNTVHRNVTYSFQSTIVPFQVTLRLDQNGKIDDLYIAAASASAYQKPAYDNPAAYSEREVTIGSGAMALPGTLTVPAGEGPFPAVVLVHGSGPHDRDATILGAKPFRDLAAGLAAKGIAVLRYDKVTYEHSFKVAADPKFTLKQESVDDALEAVKLLQNTSGIDDSRIFVAGHSQGGYAMPLISAAAPDGGIAGTILLSAPSGKFANVLAEQQAELVRRVKQLGLDSTLYEQQAAMYTSIADMVNDPEYTVDHMPEQFPLQPAYWWFEQKNYVPAELAKTQTGPMLVLQGENDWQVTMKQFEGWETALKNRGDVEFKSYPKVNHLLTEYDGLSTGTEYGKPSNVSKAIIDDIANWIHSVK
ncbi:copper amine oxidase [Paenibacillus macerans]|uniref:Dienelactone hydrolase family protein n=2 Tax=Paenibacillus macerans TaxID=44252 RepID=A0A090Z5D6_PAEMA|nr:alpha/beta fold hydrolase [Paenibacillus macerans]KFN06499.1 dienelactone hydrolase family protein [Paenibacillus macerans]SUA85736.1 copper amine oxidase [Paenibacillus macerans]